MDRDLPETTPKVMWGPGISFITGTGAFLTALQHCGMKVIAIFMLFFVYLWAISHANQNGSSRAFDIITITLSGQYMYDILSNVSFIGLFAFGYI